MASTPRIDRNQKNYIINGDMRVSQRGTSFAAIANGVYSLDRYIYYKVGAMVHTITQDTDVPTLGQSGYLFQNSLRMNLTTPDTTIASTDLCAITQRIEGYNFANFAQKTFTLSFWVKATLPGIYCVAFQNSANDRSYVAEYTINAVSTWEKKTVNILASPSSGSWNYVNGNGLEVNWTIAAGTNFQQSAGSWQANATAKLATSNQVNGTNTGATDFRVTGACVYEGTLEDPAFSTFGKDYGREFAACRRYFTKCTGISGLGQTTTATQLSVNLQPEMRTTPTPGFTGALQVTDEISTDFTQSAGNVTNVSLRPNGGRVALANFTGLTAQRFYTLEPDSETYMTFDAEL